MRASKSATSPSSRHRSQRWRSVPGVPGVVGGRRGGRTACGGCATLARAGPRRWAGAHQLSTKRSGPEAAGGQREVPKGGGRREWTRGWGPAGVRWGPLLEAFKSRGLRGTPLYPHLSPAIRVSAPPPMQGPGGPPRSAARLCPDSMESVVGRGKHFRHHPGCVRGTRGWLLSLLL